jgi:hypothetical protein
MEPTPPTPHTLAFVRRLLATGVTLVDVLGGLIDAWDDANGPDGEDGVDVVIDMAAGSVGVHLRTVSPEDFERATELMEMAGQAIVSDLTMAAEIAGRRENRYRV